VHIRGAGGRVWQIQIVCAAFAAWFAVLVMTVTAAAQTEEAPKVEEITITARKRSEPLQYAPLSVSVISQSNLSDAHVDTFASVVSLAPNVAFSGGIAGVLQGQLGIRGISTLVRNIGVESNVGLYVDGVYQGRPDNYQQDLLDVAQVEILRGPQGALFGRNTLAGVFNIKTLDPTPEPMRTLRVESGSYGLARASATVAGPVLPDVLAGKLSIGYARSDGTYQHLSGGRNGDALDLFSYRGALQLTTHDAAKVILSVDGLRDRGHPAFFQVTDLAGVSSPQETTPHRINNNRPDYLYRDNYGLAVTIHVPFDFGTFTSISALRHSSYRASLDDDQEQLDNLSADQWRDTTTFHSEEIRLSGQLFGDVDYVIGTYYFDQLIKTNRLLILGSSLGFTDNPPLSTIGSVRTKSYAAFSEFDYQIGHRLNLGAGLRFTREHRTAEFTQEDPSGVFSFLGLPTLAYTGSAKSDDIAPTISLSYRIAERLMAYVRYATGFNSSAFNVDLVSSTKGIAARPERATTYEVGIKSELLERRLRANLALFTTDYDSMQVSQLLGAGVTLDNAGDAKINGYEIELSAIVSSRLRLEASLGYLDSLYNDYKNCGIPVSLGGGSTDCTGKRIIGAPRYTFQTSARYSFPLLIGTVVSSVSYNFQSSVYYEATNSNRFRSDTRNIFGMQIALITERWELSIWGKNLFDQNYVVYKDDRSAIGVRQTTAYGDPRSYGVTAMFRL